MTQQTLVLFESIESAEEYLLLLSESVREAREALEGDTSTPPGSGTAKQRDAAQLAAYNLAKLERHFQTSQRILNDLRSLRRFLSHEQPQAAISSLTRRAAPERSSHAPAACGLSPLPRQQAAMRRKGVDHGSSSDLH